MSGRLTEGFRDVIELKWSEFATLEKNDQSTNFTSIISAITRACMGGSLRAIQTALDRIDGKIAMEIDVEYPKFYILYPEATKKSDDPAIIDIDPIALPEPAELAVVESDDELPTGSLRAVLERMLDSPKKIVTDIIVAAERVDAGNLTGGDPMVKSVIVAGLMKLVHDGKIGAVFEVFDQIDGKVADKVKILGDDVFMKRYDTIAPANAEKNENGIYQVSADNVTNAWVARLEQRKDKR